MKKTIFLSCRRDDCFLLHFKTLRKGALTMTSGCDPWPWPLQATTNTSGLIEFRSELYDVWRNIEDKNDKNITFSPDSLIYRFNEEDEINSKFKVRMMCRRNNANTNIQTALPVFPKSILAMLSVFFFKNYNQRLILIQNCQSN